MTAHTFSSARLNMRPWTQSDLAAFHAIFGDPRVIWWGKHKQDLEQSQEGLERAIAEQDQPKAGLGRFAVELRSTGAVVGNVILRPATFASGIEVGYHFAFEAWGVGYATEAARATIDYAFAKVRLDQVIAAVALHNIRSLRVVEKLGMNPIGEREYSGLPHRIFEQRRRPHPPHP